MFVLCLQTPSEYEKETGVELKEMLWSVASLDELIIVSDCMSTIGMQTEANFPDYETEILIATSRLVHEQEGTQKTF